MSASDQQLGKANSAAIPATGKTAGSFGKDTLWLVKSGDRVLGPFVTAEVIRRLRAKELVVIDEVIAPQARWHHIRDEALFSSVVDEIRTGLMSVRDDTEVGESGADTITNRNSDDKTPRIEVHASATNAKFDGSINVSRISDAEIVSESTDREVISHGGVRDLNREARVGKTSTSTSKPTNSKPAHVHSTLAYTPPSGKDTDSSSAVRKTSRALWGIVAVAIVILGTSFYFFKVAPVKRAQQKAQEVLELRKEADRAWARGEFVRSQKLYEQISKEPHLDLEPDLRAAILKLRLDRETLAAKRRLEELLPKLTSSEAKTRAKIALAIAGLQSDEPLEAQNALSRLVREPESGPIAYFNLAVAQATSGLRPDAIQNLRKLETHPALGAPSKLLRALLHLKEGQARPAANAVDIDESRTVAAYRQEMLAIGAVSDWLDGNKKRSMARLKQALEMDPFQTEEFHYDPLLYLEILRWKQMLPLIKDFSGRVKTGSAKALYALALVKADRKTEASGLINETLSSKTTDAEMQAINAYLFMLQGRDDEARAALKFAKPTQGETSPLAMILEARLCDRSGDQSCSLQTWTAVTKLDTQAANTVAAQVAVARAESQIVSERSVQAVERLKVLYPNSLPVIRLYEDVVGSSNGKEPTP